MTNKPDELDDLKAAFDAATPAPDPARRAENLRLAQENFARHQESAQAARLNPEGRPMTGWLSRGVETMMRRLPSLTTALTASTALVAVGLFLAVPSTRQMLFPPRLGDSQPDLGEAGTLKPAATVTEAKPAPTTELAPPAVNQPATIDVDTKTDGTLAPAAPPPGLVDTREEAPPEGSVAKPEAKISESDAVLGIAQGGEAATATANEAPMEVGRLDGLVAPAPRSGPALAAEPMLADDKLTLAPIEPGTEAFANEAANPVKIAKLEPVSTFSIDVDTASYSVVRSSLMAGYLPDPMAVRIEEMVNYFPYAYAAPEGDKAFQTSVSVMQTPWNKDTELVHIAIQGQMPALEDRPPLNLVFLIDTSGSMADANKLPLLKQSFRLLVNQLRPEDKVAMVTYAGSAGLVLEPTEARETSKILAALERLESGGSTAGQEGLQQAYAVTEDMMRDSADGTVSRVLLATDGDFIAGKRDSGTYLSVLGFGRGNLDDATMQALAQNGNGTAAYIDTLSEAQKVLVDQLTGALFPIAGDVKIQVEWNPATVAEYRLIGYETRALAREDFNNDRVDAGEIGAGHTVTAIYEVTPVGSPAVLNTDLRYQPTTPVEGPTNELGFLRLRHKAPGSDVSTLEETPIPVGITEAGTEARFAAAIAGFGQLLQGSPYLGNWTYGDAIALANGAKGSDDFGYRAEAVTLMRLAETLSKN